LQHVLTDEKDVVFKERGRNLLPLAGDATLPNPPNLSGSQVIF
jgi:hypothetical protein